MLLRAKAHQQFVSGGSRESKASRSGGNSDGDTLSLPKNFRAKPKLFNDAEDLSWREKAINYYSEYNSYLFKFLIIAGYYAIGVGVYMTYEGWSPLLAVYFVTQTVTTVGLGNVTPSTDFTKVSEIASK